MSIGEIEIFAAEIEALGKEYGYPPLVSWGVKLSGQVTLFEMDGMQQTMACFPALIDDIGVIPTIQE